MLQSNEKTLVYFLFIPGLLSYDPRACFPFVQHLRWHLPNPNHLSFDSFRLSFQLKDDGSHSLSVTFISVLKNWLYRKWTISMQDVSFDPVRSDYR